MKGALLICQKEFLELMKDRRTVFFSFLLPILLYPVLFLVVAGLGHRDAAQRMAKASQIAILDPSQVLEPHLRADTRRYTWVTRPDDPNRAIQLRTLDLFIEVEALAKDKLEGQRTFQVKAMMDSTEPSSALALERLKESLGTYDRMEVARRLEILNAPSEFIHPSRLVLEEVAGPGLGTAKTLGAFLPYLLILMMFQGSMQHGIHVTAGEKERGTLQSLLATALPRSQIIWGKLVYIFCMGMIAAVLNLLSMGLSMAIAVQRLGPGATRVQSDAAASLARMADPAILLVGLLLLLPLGLLFSSFILFMGIRAHSAAEAGTSLMPGLLLILVLGAVSLAPGIERMTSLAYVPVLNVSLAIRKLFSQQGVASEVMIAFAMTSGFSILMTWAATKLLDREKVLFRQR